MHNLYWHPGLSRVLKNKLHATQNKIIRFVLNMDSRAHGCSDVFKSIGWLPASKRVDQIILNHALRLIKSGQYRAFHSGKFHALIWN